MGFVIGALLACMSVALFKVVTSSGVHDRVLAINAFSTCGVILIVALGALFGTLEFFVDISLVYACVGLLSTTSFVKFFSSGER